MSRIALSFLFLLATVSPACAGPAGSEAELESLLHEFLAGASVNDAVVHQRFWAEDLVYTSSSGARFGKNDILEGLKSEQEQPAAEYSAEDVDIRQYGRTAVVAFRLVSREPGSTGVQAEYFNTGTFVERDGYWQAVAWQATRIPEAGPDG